MKRFVNIAFITLLLILAMSISASAKEAENITENLSFTFENIDGGVLFDDKISSHSGGENVKIQISSQAPMGGIYIKYYDIPEAGHLSDGSNIAEYGYIHEFIPLGGNKNEILTYARADICELKVYSQGEIPDDVQIWEKGDADTDVLLCATHSDDDQLFFAGLLPKYTAIGANVRVAYFVNHDGNRRRIHELLDGLWHCGIRNYPDISKLPDAYAESAEEAISNLEKSGFSYEDALEYQRYLLEKYKPLVVVLHDFEGEYGHGQHMLNTKSFIEAVKSADKNEYVPKKVYVHLYEENPILLDIDTPLDELNGKTPFNISQEAFKFHQTQHWTWFYDWIYGKNEDITNSNQITSYNPAEYGLYYSSVGEDKEKNDILENIETYAEEKARSEAEAEQSRLEEQSQSEAEAERSRAEADKQESSVVITESNESIVSEHAPADNENQNGCPAIYLIPAVIILSAGAIILIFAKKKR